MDTKTMVLDVSVVNKFVQHMKDNNIKQKFIVKKLDISRGHASEVLNGNRALSEALRNKLNELFDTDF